MRYKGQTQSRAIAEREAKLADFRKVPRLMCVVFTLPPETDERCDLMVSVDEEPAYSLVCDNAQAARMAQQVLLDGYCEGLNRLYEPQPRSRNWG